MDFVASNEGQYRKDGHGNSSVGQAQEKKSMHNETSFATDAKTDGLLHRRQHSSVCRDVESKEEQGQSKRVSKGTESRHDATGFALYCIFHQMTTQTKNTTMTKSQLITSLKQLGADEKNARDLAAGVAPGIEQISYEVFQNLARPYLRRAALHKPITVSGNTISLVTSHVQVFLGGACNPTTWRRDIAIPQLQNANITFYNPQVEDWSPELVQIEADMKESALVLLFVIGAQTRSIASMIEAAEYIAIQRNVILVIEPLDPNYFSPDELKDLERGREYLADIATRNHMPIYATIPEAVDALIHYVQTQ